MSGKVDAPVVIGRLRAVFAIHGWLKVESFTRPRGNITDYQQFLIRTGDSWQELGKASWKRHGNQLLVHFAGIEDRDQAQGYVGHDLGVLRAALPPLAAGEYYWSDLIGMAVRDQVRGDLGTVKNLIETGANDVLVVGDRESVLIPFLPAIVVKEVDMAARTITVDWPADDRSTEN